MPLQNRVDPFGTIYATTARGTMMGNRGGRIHDGQRQLGRRRWTSRRWIACELVYKDWRRPVMGPGYTEQFFLDEVTALSAGHRPCFFCRRAEARAFARAFTKGLRRAEPADADARDGADAMDLVLHAQRLDRKGKRRHPLPDGELPDGAVLAVGATALTRRGSRWLRWSETGWSDAAAPDLAGATLLTPPAIVTALEAGFTPRWHPSAEA